MSVKTRFESQTTVSQQVKTKARLAPEMVQSLQVLVMQAADLEEYILDAAEKNPMLEVDFENDLFGFSPMPSEEAFEGAMESFADDRVECPEKYCRSRASQGPVAGAVEWDFSRIQDQCMETETLAAYLHLQASALRLSPQDQAIMDALIEGVSEDGYFVLTSAQVAFDLEVKQDRVDILLEILRGFKPVGVAAFDLADCLLRQVEPTEPMYETIVMLIERHLSDLAEGRIGLLSRELGLPKETVIGALGVLKSLNPRPGSEFYQRPEYEYVVPDIVITCNNGSFEASVLGASTPALSINAEYARMLGDDSLPKEAREYLQKSNAEAQAVLKSLDSRKGMLEHLAAVLLRRQARFFVTEGRVLAPMTMQDVADELGVHVSTVSRAVSGKYLQAPWGCIPMKSLFTRALPKTGAQGASQQVSSNDVKSMIANIIAAEPKDNPHSDQGICDILNGYGIEVKRRTVAKYRSALGIDSQSGRKWANRAAMGNS